MVKYLVINTTVSQIFLKILKTKLLFQYRFVICYGGFIVSKKTNLGYEGVIFIKDTSLILLMRVNLLLEKWVQWRKKCVVDSTMFPQLHQGFIVSTKLYWNLCSLWWLKPTRNLVKSLIPFVIVHLICYMPQVYQSLIRAF